MKIRSIGLLLCGGSLLLAVSTLAVIPAAATTLACSPTKVRITTLPLANSSTSSSNFVNIPGAAVTFTQGAAGGCIIVRFSATTRATNPIDVLGIRALLDNVTPGNPAEIGFRNETDTDGYPHSFEFVFPSVGPGSHTVRMQYNNSKGALSHVKGHNTVVHFVP